MMCHKIGRPPISTMGFGLRVVSSDIRVPSPPARMTAFTILARLLLKAMVVPQNKSDCNPPGVRTGEGVSGREPLPCDGQQIAAIFGFSELASGLLQIIPADKSHPEGNFFRTAHPEALPFFQGSHKFRGVEHRIRCAGIQPCEPPPETFDMQLTHPQISGDGIGDFKLTPR